MSKPHIFCYAIIKLGKYPGFEREAGSDSVAVNTVRQKRLTIP